MYEWLSIHWQAVLAIAGTLFGIIGIYYGKKGWKRKTPIYHLRSNNFFSGIEHAVPDVEVKFPGYGQPIKALTVTKIAFWNGGTETIKKQDVVKDDPVAIHAKEGIVLLSASVIEVKSPLSKIECKLNHDRTIATITFEYLDHKQGANLQVFHTGVTNADIAVKGTIMGASPIRKIFRGNANDPQIPLWMPLLFFGVLWSIWGLAELGMLPDQPVHVQPVPAEPLSANALGIALLVLTVLFGFIMYLFHIPKPFSKILRQ